MNLAIETSLKDTIRSIILGVSTKMGLRDLILRILRRNQKTTSESEAGEDQESQQSGGEFEVPKCPQCGGYDVYIDSSGEGASAHSWAAKCRDCGHGGRADFSNLSKGEFEKYLKHFKEQKKGK